MNGKIDLFDHIMIKHDTMINVVRNCNHVGNTRAYKSLCAGKST